jgi:hypothetical protein
MSIIFVVILTLFLLFPKTAQAQIPLFHQLIAIYQPQKHQHATGQILGLTSTKNIAVVIEPKTEVIPSPPLNIGGEGSITTIAFLGDSMIQTLDSQIIEKSLNRYYPNHKFNILNYGQGGTGIEFALSRLPSLLSEKPNIVVIESFAYNNFGNTQSGIDRQWLALSAITTDIQKNLPDSKILLATTIAPHSVVFGNGSQFNFTSLEKIEKTNTIKLYLQNLVNFATSQNFPLADAFTESLVNKQGNLNFISKTDHIHPSPQGVTFFADTLTLAIKRYLLI